MEDATTRYAPPGIPLTEACESCRYWREVRGDYSDFLAPGRCHFAPPSGNRTWPLTRAKDWCGKFTDARGA